MIKFDQFQSINKDGMEAFVASATAWTKGMQAMALESADFSRKAFEKNAQAHYAFALKYDAASNGDLALYPGDGDANGGNLEPRLIGFLRRDDKKFFEKFITVKGIGPKKALKALALPRLKDFRSATGGAMP